jgi:hypothetical protein
LHLLATFAGTLAGGLNPEAAAAAACPKGKKRCRKKCVPKKQCCTNAHCRPAVTGRICRNGRCVCPPARPRTCQGRFIARTDCCPACPAGQVCRAGGCCYATSEALRAALEPGGPAVIPLCPNTTYSGTYTIGRDVTVIGAGAASSILDGGGGPVVTVAQEVTAQLHRVRITNGVALAAGGAGIRVQPRATLTLRECNVTGNNASFGGGILTTGTVFLDGGSITGNEASASGGGIDNSGLLVVRNGSSISGNAAANVGGGIINITGTVSIEDTSSVTNNTASNRGGGIFSSGIEGTPPRPAALFLSGASQVARNSALSGGGIFYSAPGEVRFAGSSCVGPNPVGGDCAGTECVICP